MSILTKLNEQRLNWKKIDENWIKFIELNILVGERNHLNYFYGQADIYFAKEYFEEFK